MLLPISGEFKKKYFVHAAWLVIKLYESSGHLFPLGGYSFAVSSLQLHPVFGGISK